ncbi:bifunctional metallophosphatase/5'-nucleotidase [Cohnella mopanensis]|uniref:bifunctional metallophosphatase/5'-nucleotidase n=1 Tax=Cohnella mopanensis TaxID=2911966 RepID=UPI001EF90F1E|nr:bifunctional UDP-sugar hydrolase/5'-nucleotidase [Cohnella mopanensis]
MNDAANVTLTLLHTNDLHSHFEQTSRIAGYFAQVRSQVDPEKLITVDCGDFIDRAMMETEGTKGALNRAIIEYIGYDAVTLGNNEGLSYTSWELDELFHGMPIPFVCANMMLKDTGQCPSWMVPTLRLEKSGVRIGLIGLTAPYNDYYELLGWNAADPLTILEAEVNLMRSEVDVLILLSHLGLRQDENIAASIEGIDIILGGHTHHLLEVPMQVGRTAICAAGKFGEYVGHLQLELNSDRKLIGISGGSLSTASLPRLPEMDELIGRYRVQAKRNLNRLIANLAEPIELRYNQESPLPTLLACAIRQLTTAEIGLVNAGQFLEQLPSGPVTEELIHAICPSPINACNVKLSGSSIVRSLEESLLPEFQELAFRGFGFRGKVLGMLCVDGLEIMADLDQEPYHRILDIKVNGVPLDEKRQYSVGTLDMFTFGVGYIGLKEGHDVRYYLPEFIRDVMATALNDQALIKSCRTPRWRFADQQ